MSCAAPGSGSRSRRASSASPRRPPGSRRSSALPDVQGATVVCIVTGHGLKDTGAVDEGGSHAVEATLDAVLEAIG